MSVQMPLPCPQSCGGVRVNRRFDYVSPVAASRSFRPVSLGFHLDSPPRRNFASRVPRTENCFTNLEGSATFISFALCESDAGYENVLTD
jgi:hypothetical protein